MKAQHTCRTQILPDLARYAGKQRGADSSETDGRISGWCRVLLGHTRREQRVPITRGLPTSRAVAFVRTRRLSSDGLRDG